MSFPNPRLHTIPAERLRARCVLAERFISAECMEDNGATVDPAVSVNRGATITGPSDVIQSPVLECDEDNKITLFVRFSCIDSGSNAFGAIGGNIMVLMIDGTVSASHGTSDSLQITADYMDGEEHTVMYIVDTEAGTHTLIFDGEVVTGSTSVTASIAETEIAFSGSQIHTWYHALLFNDALTAYDYEILSDEKWADFLNENLFAFWRCNSRTNDTIGGFFRNTTGLIKFTMGDGSDSDTFPELDGDNGEEFFTVGSAQYLDDAPDFPDEYTCSVAHSDTVYDGRFPVVTQEDSARTLIDSLGTPGGFSYENLHSIWVSDRELYAIEKLHIQYLQLHDNWRSSCRGAVAQLINEGVCCVALMFNCPTMYRDIAHTTARYASAEVVTSNGNEHYVQFLSAGSRLELAHQNGDEDQRQLTWILFGEISQATSTRTIIYKSTSWNQDSNSIDFGGSSLESDLIDNATEFLAVSATDGYRPRFFADELFAGLGDSTVSLPDNETANWIFGNTWGLSQQLTGVNAKAFVAFNAALTDEEIRAVYYSLKKSFEYEKPANVISEIIFDSPGQTTVYNDSPGQSTVINDGVA